MSSSAASPRIIPVLDLRGGVAVHAVAGDRANYHPLKSDLVNSSSPLEIARAVRDRYTYETWYVADLDGIQHGRPDWETLSALAADGLQLCVDAGVRGVDDARRVLEAGVTHVIAALETSPGPRDLAELVRCVSAERLIFSLDLQAGRPMLPTGSAWSGLGATQIVEQAVDAGVQTLLVLDLAGVGRGDGIPTLPLCRELKQRFPALALWTGGGVRSMHDVTAAGACGAAAVLVGTALQTGEWLVACS
jgi:phosphoribosylformimino-5-aminoimidazole carboxamide ribotide isomerase